MSSESTEEQEVSAVPPTPVKAVKSKQDNKKEKKKPAADKMTFVGRIADLEVSMPEAAAPHCIFRLKGKKAAAKQSFSIPSADHGLNSLLLQTALFSFANQIKVHVATTPSVGDVHAVRSIKLSQKN